MAEAKPASKSKTIWVNSLVLGGGVAVELGAWLDQNWAEGMSGPGFVAIAVAVFNIALRLVTKSPILFPPK